MAAPGGGWQALSIQSSVQPYVVNRGNQGSTRCCPYLEAVSLNNENDEPRTKNNPGSHPLTAKTFFIPRCSIPMRLPALFLALLASLPLFAADEKKPTEPVAKPVEKPEPAVKKKKKGLDAPEIPAGVSLVDGVKLQEAWLKAESDEEFKAAVAKLGGAGEKPKKSKGEKKEGGARDAKEAREAIDAARVKAMQKAEPALKIDLIRDYVESSHQKKSDGAGKTKKK